MTNVKVHLNVLIKYVLLLGVAVQGLFGIVVISLWLLQAPTPPSAGKALLGVGVGILLSYLFLREWCWKADGKGYVWGCAGIVSTPVVLHSCLDCDREFFLVVSVCAVLLIYLRIHRWISKKWQKTLASMLALLLAGGLCWTGSAAPSLAAGVTSRTGFPYLYEDAYNLPEELLQWVNAEELRDACSSAEGIYTRLYPLLLERSGDAAAVDKVCNGLTAHCVSKNTKGVLENILWDVAAYHFPQPVSEMQLRGMGYDSVTGANYGELLIRAGAVTRLYWDYGVVWYLLSTLLLAVLWRSDRFDRRKAFVVLFLEVVVLCLCMEGAGYFDYKKLLLPEFIRMGMILEGVSRGMIEKDE